MTNIKVTGLAELQKFLDEFPAKMEANVMRGALRAGAKPIKEAVLANIPVGPTNERNKRVYKGYEGALRDSVRISGRINNKKGQVSVSVKAGGKVRKTGADVFYAHMVEFGTRPHSLAKDGKGQINHPGTLPRPFMRPAIDSESVSAVIAAGEYIKKRLATRNGINTAELDIGIDLE